LQYPLTSSGSDVDQLHGELVADPYRWLEDTEAAATRDWIAGQNALTESVLEGCSAREEIRARLTELWDYPRYGVPSRHGERWFQARNTGLQNQAVLFVMAAPEDEGRVLLDPNTLSADGTVALSGLSFSDDGSLLAYATSEGGSDWMTWRVRDVESGKDLDDVIEWSKYSGASWRKDGTGFYYGALDAPEPGQELLAQSRLLRVLFHRLGTVQEDDRLVFELPDDPELMPTAKVTDDGRFLVITIGRGTFPERRILVLDLTDPDAGFQPLVPELDTQSTVIGNEGSDFYLLTDLDAERRRVVRVPLGSPGRESWVEVVPESEDTLTSVVHFGGRLVCAYLHHAQSRVRVFSTAGDLLHEIEVPAASSLTELAGRLEDDELFFATTSFVDAGTVWSHDLATATTKAVRRIETGFDGDTMVTEQVFVPSVDGTLVPVFLVRHRDLEPTGDVPVWLYGYGGFNAPMTPTFAVSRAVWLERGGMIAVANLRGGGEYGKAWYDGGRLANKQNVFDDFCAVARWLTTSGWSRPERIAINGGSNGGLLVGACLTQAPELFGAAVPEVGVLDLLRFHKFTIGWAWMSDYGNPDDPLDYAWVRAYSPLHNVVPGKAYPATLVMTGDRDDRVVPGHSFKFTAALQTAQGGKAPVLIRVETSAGHGAGKPTSKLIAERTDMLAFLEHALITAPSSG